MFEVEYSRWLEEEERYVAELQRCLNIRLPDGDLRLIVDECLNHHDEICRLKDAAMKSDIFYILSGAWATHAERCFMWVGGFRPSEILKVSFFLYLLFLSLLRLSSSSFLGIISLSLVSFVTSSFSLLFLTLSIYYILSLSFFSLYLIIIFFLSISR